MYRVSEEESSSTLICQGEGPDLICSDAFWVLVETLPDKCLVPTPIVKLGILSQHLKSESDKYEIKSENIDIESISTAIVPPPTLSRVRWLLTKYTDHLSGVEKKKVGKLCQVSKLNRPPEIGESNTERIKSGSRISIGESLFLKKESKDFECEHCGTEYDSAAALNGHLSACDERQTEKRTKKSFNKQEYTCKYCDKSFRKKLNLRVHKKRNCDKKSSSKSSSDQRPAFGKEIRKDKGSERVSGRNPFADPDKLKDTGLHQGGN